MGLAPANENGIAAVEPIAKVQLRRKSRSESIAGDANRFKLDGMNDLPYRHLKSLRRTISQMAKKILIGIAALLVVFGVAVALALYVYPKAQITAATQQTAPDFTLRDATGQDFTLSSQRGHKVVLYFYRGYW